MYHPDQVRHGDTVEPEPVTGGGHGRCLVAGCPCKDARIVSLRRAAFFADLARRAGETANRVIAPDAGWRLPAPSLA